MCALCVGWCPGLPHTALVTTAASPLHGHGALLRAEVGGLGRQHTLCLDEHGAELEVPPGLWAQLGRVPGASSACRPFHQTREGSEGRGHWKAVSQAAAT